MSGKWAELQQEFLIEHEKTGITVQSWCLKKGLNYASARRYIKATVAKAKVKNKVGRAINVIANAEHNNIKHGNVKHGGYTQYFNADINALTSETALDDELALCRARIHLVVKTIEEIQRRLEQKVEVEVATSLYESLFKADTALDRNIARVESITKTLSTIRLDDLQQSKIRADTNRSVEITKATVINAKKSIAQTELTRLQVEQTRKELGGTSKLDQFIDDLTDGLDKVVS